MNLQGVVMNVADLNRSIAFYREVLGFTLLSHEEQLAAVSAPGTEQAQVIVLRALGTSPGRSSPHRPSRFRFGSRISSQAGADSERSGGSEGPRQSA